MKTLTRFSVSVALALVLTACGQNQKNVPQETSENNEEAKITQLVIDFVNQNGKDNIHITRLSKVHPKMKLYADFSETEEGLAILKRIRCLMDSIKEDVDVFKTTGLKMKVMNLSDDYRAAESEYKPTVVKGWRVRCNLDAITVVAQPVRMAASSHSLNICFIVVITLFSCASLECFRIHSFLTAQR